MWQELTEHASEKTRHHLGIDEVNRPALVGISMSCRGEVLDAALALALAHAFEPTPLWTGMDVAVNALELMLGKVTAMEVCLLGMAALTQVEVGTGLAFESRTSDGASIAAIANHTKVLHLSILWNTFAFALALTLVHSFEEALQWG